jgi:glucosamine-6-phosphate deaminase
MLKTLKKDKLTIQIYETRKELGEAAAAMASAKINELLAEKDEVNIIFAAAPSQNEFLAALLHYPLEWNKINAFHMDEYVALDAAAPQGFGNFLRNAIFDRVTFKNVNFLNGNAADLQQECERYAALLQKYPTDVVCMGIGENAHIAFNDPHVANFNDSSLVKVVDLDEECRMQQVNDGCFAKLNEVPTHALTLTVPALISAKFAYCVVPGPEKSKSRFPYPN